MTEKKAAAPRPARKKKNTRAKKAPAKKHGGGQPAHVPTEEMRTAVSASAGYGLTQAEVANICGISVDTLRKYYHEDWKASEARRNMSVSRSLYRTATNPDSKGHVAAAIWWEKTRQGKREVQRMEISGLKEMAAELASEYGLTAEEAIAEAEALIAAERAKRKD